MKDFKVRDRTSLIFNKDGSNNVGPVLQRWVWALKKSVEWLLLQFMHNSDVKSKLILLFTTHCILLPNMQ